MNSNIIDRRLPDRSLLTFIYKDSSGDDIQVRLPFFENVRIIEQKRARYEQFKILSRSSDLYAYLGADSRSFKLEFSMTLPHIQDQIKDLHRSQYTTLPGESVSEKALFSNQGGASGSTATRLRTDYLTDGGIKDTVKQLLNSDWGRKGITPKEKEELIARYGGGAVLSDASEFTSTNEKTSLNVVEAVENAKTSISDKYQGASQLIDTVMFWVNTVRSSMSTAAGSYNSGPPIIRLNHGIMYQDVPCICKDVNISSDEAAGYDLDTLLPRKIDISMSLEEYRLGNFGQYSPSDAARRDNLAGWEAVIEHGTMDPGRLL